MEKEINPKVFNNLMFINDIALLDKNLANSIGIRAQYFNDIRKKLQNETWKISAKIAKDMTTKQIEKLQKRANNGDYEARKILLEITKKDIPAIRRQMLVNIINNDLK